MKTIALVLSGCGVKDGSEIHESVIALLALLKAGARVVCAAPDIEQYHAVNHITGEVEAAERRFVLKESARIARGDITAIEKLDIKSLGGAVFPGGYGAVKNNCNYAYKGNSYTVEPTVAQFIQKMHAAQKPLGFLCIAPMIAASVLGGEKIRLTIGNDAATARALEAQGAVHVPCALNEIVVDEKAKVISTPAYMLARNIAELEPGIEKLVERLLQF